jgi:hypothetical protein
MRRLLIISLLLMWLAVTACGMVFIWSYSHKPGVAAASPRRWPSDTTVPHAAGHYTMVMLAHPKCPCTQASVEELSRLMTHTQGRIDVYVLFAKPEGFSESWSRTDLWNSAAVIPGVTVILDRDAAEARRFGAATSGQVLLYDQAGSLVFQGGITESRGHAGDNAGRAAIETLVNHGVPDRDRTPVFGCPLFDPDLECRKPEHARASN